MSKTPEIPQILNLDGKSISPYFFEQFLTKHGFGKFMTSKDRTSTPYYFKNDNNVLKIHSPESIRVWVIGYIKSCITEETMTDAIYVLEKVQKLSDSMLEGSVLIGLKSYGDFSSEDAETLKITSDASDKCYVRFRNGIVVITERDIRLIPYSRFKSDGSVWESSIIDRDIEIDRDSNRQGLFEKFFVNSMRKRDPKIVSTDDWRDEYPITSDTKRDIEALKTSYGYLLHRKNTEGKAIIFVDTESTLTSRQGQNGKSLIMESVEHFTERAFINGEDLFKNSGEKRFSFSNVTPSTGMIHIDELDRNFKFDQLFAYLTGDLVIQGKGTNKVIIPKEKKPKFGITTNYVIAGTGASYERRQHIIEFGNYWNRLWKERESTSDQKHLGKWLFGDEFTDQDWNDFYNFGFRCIQTYLEWGLLDTSSGSYSDKVLARSIAEEPEVGQWIMNYVKERRLVNDPESKGVYMYQIYEQFSNDLTSDITSKWDSKRLYAALFEYVMGSDGYDWNPEKSNKGSSLTARRVLKGQRGQQQTLVRIVHKDDQPTKKSDGDYLSILKEA